MPPLTLDAFDDVAKPEILLPFFVAVPVFMGLSGVKRPVWLLLVGLIGLGLSVYSELSSAGGDFDWVSHSSPDMALAQSFVPFLFFPFLVALHLLFAWILVRAFRAGQDVPFQERARISESDSASDHWSNTARSLVNIPQANRYARSRVWTGFLMMVAGLANFMNFWRKVTVIVFVSLAQVLAVELFPKVGVVIRALIDGRNLARVALDMTVVSLFLAFYLAVIWIIPWSIKWLCRWCVRRSEKQMRTSLEQIQYLDDRAPILYLRPFINDKVPLPSDRTFTPWLLDDAGAMESLDMMMLAEGTRFGPTVGLGNPDDPFPPYGVARGYFEHDSWKDAVKGLCERSAAIVLVLDKTEGVKWEVGHIAARRHTSKVLFLLAPTDVGVPRGYTLLSEALERAAPNRDETGPWLEQDAANQVFGFCVHGNTVEFLTTSAPDKFDYLVALRRFLRRLLSSASAEHAAQGDVTPSFPPAGIRAGRLFCA